MRASYRTVAVTGMVAMCATGMSVLEAGSASAAPATIPLDSCNTTVQANAGDSLAVTAKTLLAPQLAGLSAVPVVGPPAADALGAALSSMQLGAFPVTQSPGTISGAEIAKAVAAALPAAIPADLVTGVVAPNCGITITKPAEPAEPAAVAPATQRAPVSSGNATAPAAAPAPVAAEAPAVTSYGSVPRTDYSNLTAVPAGGAGYSIGVAPTMAPKSLTGYGLPTAVGTTPTLAPQFGLLTAPPNAPSAAPSTLSAAAVQPVMSEVTALPVVPASSTRVPAEAVLAALLLSLTTAALVRTWVLRRSAH